MKCDKITLDDKINKTANNICNISGYKDSMNYSDSTSHFSVIEKAILYATKAHSGMRRKGADIPFILHPLEAAAIVATITDKEDIIAAAILHDVLEDTDSTFEELEREFGDIALLVAAESENKRRELPAEETWKVRKQETIDYLKNHADRNEKIITLGDKLSNIRSIQKDYKLLGEELWLRFNQKKKEEHGWYYREIGKALKELQEYHAYQEYLDLVRKVFGDEGGHE